jgi:hypothetical protein
MRQPSQIWTEIEEAKLREIYPGTKRETLAGLFGSRSVAAICSRAKVLGIRKNRERKIWTAADDAKLSDLYATAHTREVAIILGCTKAAAERRAQKLGLHKDPEFLRKFCRLQPGCTPPNKGKHGQPPPNKGLRRPGYFRGRMRETQFKRGSMPWNTLPLWSFRINTDGYLLLKTGKPGPKPNSGWEFVHKIIWEQAHGPLPSWRIARLWWRDGDRTNCALSNLELVPGGEHMARTTLHNFPEPLKKVIILKGALRRRIRRMEKIANDEKHNGRSQESSLRNDRSA